MNDKIPEPSIVTHVRVGNFILHVYAYRTLTKAECKIAIDVYKSQNHISKLPARGSAKLITLLGNDPTTGR